LGQPSLFLYFPWFRLKIVGDFPRGIDGSQEAWKGSEESMSLLHERRLPATGFRRLQGRAGIEEAVHQSGQDF
jgi:hypothetical protein